MPVEIENKDILPYVGFLSNDFLRCACRIERSPIHLPTPVSSSTKRDAKVGEVVLFDHSRPDITRLELMLALAFRSRLELRRFAQFMSAAECSRIGDQALANLRLTVAGLSRLLDADDLPDRISMADLLLDRGMRPNALLKALGLDEAPAGFEKYDPNQPRVPAGNGSASGRWTDGGVATAASVATAIALQEAPILGPAFSTAALRAAAIFLGGIGFGTAFGLLVVPSSNGVVSNGPMPGNTGQTYAYDQAAGVLRVQDATGQVLAAGVRDRDGVFADAQTGVPFARELGGSIAFGQAAITAARTDASAQSTSIVDTQTDTQREEPKLCPEPGPDQPGSEAASKRAKAYQEQISRMVNPQRPLPYGTVPALISPFTGGLVHYDECDERTGDMIEAKGPGFDGLLQFGASENVTDRWLKQGRREVDAPGSRRVIWYFAERAAADHARDLFSQAGLGKIIVRVQPAVNP